MKKRKDRQIDGYLLGLGGKLGYFALGFCLSIVGVFIAWGIGHRKKMMECSAEAIYLALEGAATYYIVCFVAAASGFTFPALIAFGDINGWHIFGLVASILLIILSAMWIYGMKWKQTPVEKVTAFPGDEWIKPGEKFVRYDAGITIDAPAGKVWPYVKQVGQTQAGWYSFDWLERLFTFDIHNHYDIHPEWQNLKAGDYQWFHQAPLSIGEWVTSVSDKPPYGFASHSDSRTDPNPGPNQEKPMNLPIFKYFCWTWNWLVVPVDKKSCRLLWRCDCTFAPYIRPYKWLVVFILGTASIVMGRNFMDTMKALCEGRLRYSEKNK